MIADELFTMWDIIECNEDASDWIFKIIDRNVNAFNSIIRE